MAAAEAIQVTTFGGELTNGFNLIKAVWLRGVLRFSARVRRCYMALLPVFAGLIAAKQDASLMPLLRAFVDGHKSHLA